MRTLPHCRRLRTVCQKWTGRVYNLLAVKSAGELCKALTTGGEKIQHLAIKSQTLLIFSSLRKDPNKTIKTPHAMQVIHSRSVESEESCNVKRTLSQTESPDFQNGTAKRGADISQFQYASQRDIGEQSAAWTYGHPRVGDRRTKKDQVIG